MGLKLLTYFDQASKIGGIEGRVALARYTGQNSMTAKSMEDTFDNIQKFEKAIAQIKREFSTQNGNIQAPVSTKIEKSNALKDALNKLVAEKSQFISNPDLTYRKITETAARAMDIERVGIWFYDSANQTILCKDLFEKKSMKHSSGIVLSAKDYPEYFKALEMNRAINAHDANLDPRTSCFSASYLKPLNISSMLDIPIYHQNVMKGVICQEHIGPKRIWSFEEADFGMELAKIITESL
jgi:two-component system, sensor histidine kinase and response regulator